MILIVTGAAKLRIQEISDYYKSYVSARVANKIRSSILSALKYVKANPNAGQIEELIDHSNIPYRRHVVGNYKIIYRIEANVIYVTDVFDARQNPAKVLL